ncbi:hypothetical protein G6M87_10840 [Rhizobium rhizogenes]|uniref:hypothetical protein n=1 Tax=Rhizobium rhizogenes TaxID=359 RepID=UPI00157251B5|nr:hypothetical protein [Rhizobium rhizogenes]NTI22353.1 hypothetical protein [Rhizobium rhizogenes]QTG05941.1 hypothetical protein G6M87_10840 [Rhizobium rhizogenes]
MSNLARWRRIALERAVTAEMATVEFEEAKKSGDPDKIAVANRYFVQANRMLVAANVKLGELAHGAA